MGFELPIPLINTLSSAIYARDPHLLYTNKDFFSFSVADLSPLFFVILILPVIIFQCNSVI